MKQKSHSNCVLHKAEIALSESPGNEQNQHKNDLMNTWKDTEHWQTWRHNPIY